MAARRDLERHLQGKEILPIYALVSEQPALLHDAAVRLRDLVVTVAPDFNRDAFNGGEAAIERVLEAARTLPMMAPRRFVTLVDMDRLKPEALAALVAYIAAPCPTTVVCLMARKLDQRTKIAHALSAAKALFTLDPPGPRELPDWIASRVADRGGHIARDAAALLADWVGGEVGSLDRTIDLLLLYTNGAAIDVDAVETVAVPIRSRSVFELTDAIGRRDLAQALLLLRGMAAHDEPALRILALIARQFRLLLQARSGASAAEFRLPPHVASALQDQARGYDVAELAGALVACAAADLRIKSSRQNPILALEHLVTSVVERTKAKRV